MRCYRCNNETPEGSKFCKFCGAPMAPESFTPAQSSSASPAKTEYPSAPDNAPKRRNTGLIITIIALTAAIFVAAALIVCGVLNVGPLKGVFGNHPAETQKPPEPDTVQTDETTTTKPDTTTLIEQDDLVSPYFEDDRTYVYYNPDFTSNLCSCVEFAPDGTFIYTENLLSGIGKMFGSYEIDGDTVTLTVNRGYDPLYAGSDVKTIAFEKEGDNLVIRNAVCSTQAGDTFIRNDSYFVPDEFYIDENYDDGESGNVEFLDRPVTMWVNVGTNANGSPLYLFLRSTPSAEDDNKIAALPHGAAVTVYGKNSDGSWAWIHYEGPAHNPDGTPTEIDVYAWCAMNYQGNVYLVSDPVAN